VIIPFASGEPRLLVTASGGIARFGAVIGFGASADDVDVTGATINLVGGAGIVRNMAFSMPRDGTLVELTGFFSTSVIVDLPPPGAFVIVRLYRSGPLPSNIFAPLGPALLLPLPPGEPVPVGTPTNGTVPLGSLPVFKQERLILVVSVIVPGQTGITTFVSGYLSAGLAIV